MLRAGPVLFGVLLLTALSGCAPQQLIMPDPLLSSAQSEQAHATRRREGVRMSDPPDPETREATVLPGTGELVGSPPPRALAANPAPGDAVSLSLNQASIASAAKVVLGDLLRSNYTVSDKVTGTITLSTPQPVSRARLLEMFEGALQAQGAGIAVAGGVHRVLPLEEALAAGARFQARGAVQRDMVGMSTEVVQLKYVTAGDMERLLRGVAPPTTVVRTDQQRNLLILTGTRGDLASLADAVAVFDVDWMKGMSFAHVPIESADPEAIAQELDVIFANESSRTGVVRFIANRRLKSILVVSARMEHLRRAEQWIRKLDQVGRATEKQVHVYHVQNRNAGELAQLLTKVYAGQDRAAQSTASIATGSIAPNAAGPGASPAAITGNEVFAPGAPVPTLGQRSQANTGLPALPAQPAQPTGPATAANGPRDASGLPALPPGTDPAAAAVSGARQGPDGFTRSHDDRTSGISVVADDANNSLVVTATASEYRRIRQILSRIDVAPAQVLLEATIAEVTLNDQLKLGMRWFFERNQNLFRLTDSPVGAISPVFPGFSWFLDKVNVQVVLNTLQTVTNVNIVSSPTLMVIDNKKAVLQVGKEVPVPTQSAVAVLAPGAPIVNSITFRNTGIILGITPRISDRGRVLLDIEQEASDVIRTTSSSIDAPTIEQRRVRTTVAVENGHSVLLAGLIQDKATRDRGQVPLLGDWPVVGNLFKNKTDTIERTELLIAITPRIVNDQGHMQAIVEEFRGKLNFNTRPQRHGPPTRREQLDRLQR